MVESRNSPRELILQTARIRAADRTDVVDCAVLNISESGACILVPAGAEISEMFELAIDHEEAIRHCRRIWQDGARLGVTFT
jgi:hypothetical protein